MENINDEDPEFVNTGGIVWQPGFENGFVPEGTPFGTIVARIEVTDTDGPEFWPDRPYALTSTDNANVGGVIIGFFGIIVEDGTGHGLLRVRGNLERESGDVINTFPGVFIRVEDDQPFDPSRLDAGRIQTDEFTITIADVNEFDPTLVLSKTAEDVDEGVAPTGGFEVITFTVEDDDDKIYVQGDFALSGDARFEIAWDEAAQTGQVLLTAGKRWNTKPHLRPQHHPNSHSK